MSVADVDLCLIVNRKNRQLSLKRPSFRTEGEFVNWVRQRAFAAAEIIPDAATRKETLGQVARDIAVGKYSWGKDAVAESLQSEEGLKEWMYFVLKQENQLLMSPDGRQWFEDAWKDEEFLIELFPKYEMLVFPNRQTPTNEASNRQASEKTSAGDETSSTPTSNPS